MTRQRARRKPLASASNVFLNVPFDRPYEPLFLALIASIVAVGRTPRSVLELPEMGRGRLSRILDHMAACAVSFHDLSRAGVPSRFNMPFELGLACALSELKGQHAYALFDRERFRLHRTLSDLDGRDANIHNRSVRRMITCVLDVLDTRNGASPLQVFRLYRRLSLAMSELKRQYRVPHVFSPSLFRRTVAVAVELAVADRLIEP